MAVYKFVYYYRRRNNNNNNNNSTHFYSAIRWSLQRRWQSRSGHVTCLWMTAEVGRCCGGVSTAVLLFGIIILKNYIL